MVFLAPGRLLFEISGRIPQPGCEVQGFGVSALMLFPAACPVAGDTHLVRLGVPALFAFSKDLEAGFAIWTCGNLVPVHWLESVADRRALWAISFF